MGRTQKGCLLKNDNGFQKHHGGFLNIHTEKFRVYGIHQHINLSVRLFTL